MGVKIMKKLIFSMLLIASGTTFASDLFAIFEANMDSIAVLTCYVANSQINVVDSNNRPAGSMLMVKRYVANGQTCSSPIKYEVSVNRQIIATCDNYIVTLK